MCLFPLSDRARIIPSLVQRKRPFEHLAPTDDLNQAICDKVGGNPLQHCYYVAYSRCFIAFTACSPLAVHMFILFLFYLLKGEFEYNLLHLNSFITG